jgi:hypothetical protein
MRYALDQALKEPITTFYKIVTHLVGLIAFLIGIS